MKTLILLQILIVDAWSNHLHNSCTTKFPLQPGDGRQRCLEHLIDGLKCVKICKSGQHIIQRVDSAARLSVRARDARGRYSQSC